MGHNCRNSVYDLSNYGDIMEEELVTISLGGHIYQIPRCNGKHIFATILATPPIDYEKSIEKANEIADKIRKMKDEGNY